MKKIVVLFFAVMFALTACSQKSSDAPITAKHQKTSAVLKETSISGDVAWGYNFTLHTSAGDFQVFSKKDLEKLSKQMGQPICFVRDDYLDGAYATQVKMGACEHAAPP